MIDITLYSPSEPLEFEVDTQAMGNPSLFVTHIEHGDRNKLRIFLPMDDLRTLRDLLNEKLPPSQEFVCQKLGDSEYVLSTPKPPLK